MYFIIDEEGKIHCKSNDIKKLVKMRKDLLNENYKILNSDKTFILTQNNESVEFVIKKHLDEYIKRYGIIEYGLEEVKYISE